MMIGMIILRHFLISVPERPPTKITDINMNVISNVVERFGSITTRKRGSAHNRASLKSTFFMFLYVHRHKYYHNNFGQF